VLLPSILLGTAITLAIMLYRLEKHDGKWHYLRGGLMRRYRNNKWEYRALSDEEGGLGADDTLLFAASFERLDGP
jgi:hypothetical protein